MLVFVGLSPGQSNMIDGRLVQRKDAWFAPRRSGFDSPASPLCCVRNEERHLPGLDEIGVRLLGVPLRVNVPTVKRRSSLVSNEVFRARILAEAMP